MFLRRHWLPAWLRSTAKPTKISCFEAEAQSPSQATQLALKRERPGRSRHSRSFCTEVPNLLQEYSWAMIWRQRIVCGCDNQLACLNWIKTRRRVKIQNKLYVAFPPTCFAVLHFSKRERERKQFKQVPVKSFCVKGKGLKAKKKPTTGRYYKNSLQAAYSRQQCHNADIST